MYLLSNATHRFVWVHIRQKYAINLERNSLLNITTPTLSTQMSTRQRSIFSWTGMDAVWSSREVDGSDANWASEFVFITKSLARIAAEDALTDVLEGSWSSPPLKHITINFCRQEKKSEAWKHSLDYDMNYETWVDQHILSFTISYKLITDLLVKCC